MSKCEQNQPRKTADEIRSLVQAPGCAPADQNNGYMDWVGATASRAMSKLDDALLRVTGPRLRELTEMLVNTASPTGEEGALAVQVAQEMETAGIEAHTGWLDAHAANAWGTLGSADRGPALLLYSPIDTITAGCSAQEPLLGNLSLRHDLQPALRKEHGWLVGLGAHNPKGHAACVLMAAEALAAAGIELQGQIIAGFGCLGMPVNRRGAHLLDGHGAGCAALIESVHPDAAVIAKSGWAVSWTEVGLAWFTVRVKGTHTYVGSRHLLNYRNPIADASQLILDLEAWFQEWAETRSDGFNRPQGIVASVTGGEARATAFTGSECEFTIDLRLPPGVDAEVAERALTARIRRRAAEIGTEIAVSRAIAIPGSRTDPSEPVVRAAIAAWEAETGLAHQPARDLSGATDANIFRQNGIPTARIGLPKVAASGVDVDFQYGMNAVDPEDQAALARQLIRTALGYLGGKA